MATAVDSQMRKKSSTSSLRSLETLLSTETELVEQNDVGEGWGVALVAGLFAERDLQ